MLKQTLEDSQKPIKKVQQPARENVQLGYQSGFNADGQAVNTGQVLSDYEGNAFFQGNDQLTDDGARGVADLNNQMTANNVSQMARSLDTNNAQKNMADQYQRSELTQQGLANQAQIYGDISQRAIDQMGLAARLQEAQIRNNFAIASQRVMQNKAAEMEAKLGFSKSKSSSNNFREALLG